MDTSSIVHSLPQTSNLDWQRIENKPADETNQVASLVFQNSRHPPVEFNPERRLVIVLLGSKESIQIADSHLQQICGSLPSLSIDTEDVLEEIKKDTDGLANACIGLMRANDCTMFPDELIIGKLSKQISQPQYKAGLILKGVPNIDLQLAFLLNPPHTRKNDTLMIFSLESGKQKSDEASGDAPVSKSEIIVNRLKVEEKKVDKIETDDPSSIPSQINTIFNQKLHEIANRQPRSSLINYALTFFAGSAITFLAYKIFISQGKEH